MESLSPEQTQAFRLQQKKRARIIFMIAVVVVIALFALTIVKGHLAEDQRSTPAVHENY